MLTFFVLLTSLAVVKCAYISTSLVPTTVAVPLPLWLNCTYTLGDKEELQQLDWCKDEAVFYTYSAKPTENKKWNVLLGKGVSHVDINKSNLGNVLLAKTDINTTGYFQCRVTLTDKTAVLDGKQITAVYFPEDKPKIGHMKNNTGNMVNKTNTIAVYEVGERINVTCCSPFSNPAATLTIVMNGNSYPELGSKGDPIKKVVTSEDSIHTYFLFKSTLNASYIISPHMVEMGYMNVTCNSRVAAEGMEGTESSPTLILRVVNEHTPVYENRDVRKHKFIFYGFMSLLFSILLIWYMMNACSAARAKNKNLGDNVSNIVTNMKFDNKGEGIISGPNTY